MKPTRTFLTLFVLLFVLALLSGCGGSQNNNTLVIGSDIPYKPFEYRDRSGEINGFDVEIAKAVFEDELGYNIRFKQNSFDTIIPSLNNGNFRVVVSAMTITNERAEKVDFSEPYFTAYQTVTVLKNSDIKSKDDLRGKVVGAQKGTTGANASESLKKEFGGELTIKKFDQNSDAFNALLNNQVEAVIMDNMASKSRVKQNKNFRFVQGKGEASKVEGEHAPDYLTLTVEQYGIAFRKGDDDLRKKVNQALNKIKQNGTYDSIYKKYFEQ